MNDPARWVRHEARRLARASAGDAADPARPLARALLASTRWRPDEDARAWRGRIEAERRRLAACDAHLSAAHGTTSTVAKVTRKASVPRRHGWLLFNLARDLGARRCLELGTCVGISGAYLAAGMATRGGGRLCSLEGHRDRAEVARAVWGRLGLDEAEVIVGRFRRTLPDVLASGPFDLVFLDGDHHGETTVDHVTRIRAACRPGAVVVIDDIDWSDDMRSAWTRLRTDLVRSTIVDLRRLGLIRLGPEDAGRP